MARDTIIRAALCMPLGLMICCLKIVLWFCYILETLDNVCLAIFGERYFRAREIISRYSSPVWNYFTRLLGRITPNISWVTSSRVSRRLWQRIDPILTKIRDSSWNLSTKRFTIRRMSIRRTSIGNRIRRIHFRRIPTMRISTVRIPIKKIVCWRFIMLVLVTCGIVSLISSTNKRQGTIMAAAVMMQNATAIHETNAILDTAPAANTITAANVPASDDAIVITDAPSAASVPAVVDAAVNANFTAAANANVFSNTAIFNDITTVNITEAAASDTTSKTVKRLMDSELADWINFLVDKHDLDADLKWQAVQVVPEFDKETLNVEPRYPNATHPVDDAPSLSVVNKRLGSTFMDVHAPGRDEFREDEKHEQLQELNDYGEVYKEGHKGKTKTEIRKYVKHKTDEQKMINEAITDATKIIQELEAEMNNVQNGKKDKEGKWYKADVDFGNDKDPAGDKEVDEDEKADKGGEVEIVDSSKAVDTGTTETVASDKETADEETAASESKATQNEAVTDSYAAAMAAVANSITQMQQAQQKIASEIAAAVASLRLSEHAVAKRGEISNNADDTKGDVVSSEANAENDVVSADDIAEDDVKDIGNIMDSTVVEANITTINNDTNRTSKSTTQLRRPKTSPLPRLTRKTIRLPVSGRGFGRIDAVHIADTNTATSVQQLKKYKNAPPDLPVIPHGALDASGLMVGVSTTFSRLYNNNFAVIDDWARWLTDGNGNSNGVFLFLALHRPRNNETEIIENMLTERGIFFNLMEDWGHVHEGVGGGPTDVHPLPVVPDADAIRYSNMLGWLKEYDYFNFGKGRPLVRQPDGTHRQPPRRRMTVYALMDDDVFVPDMRRLLAKLREHHGLSGNTCLHSPKWEGKDFEQYNENMWLGFPSDSWSDWEFHNGTTLYNQYRWEYETFGRPTTTKNLDNRFIDYFSKTELPTTYGGGAVFLAADLAHRMVDLPCMRRSTGDNVINTVFKANRAAFYRGEHTEASWDEQMYRCVAEYIPEAQLRIVPSYYAPSDAAIYGNEWESAKQGAKFSQLVGRINQYNGGTHPMVMHNHRTWHSFNVGAAHQVVDICGNDCFLQRFMFDDGWVLTNGHSLTHYDGLTTWPLERQDGVLDEGYFDNMGEEREMRTPLMMERFRVFQEQRQYYQALHMEVEAPARPRDLQALDWSGEQKTYRLVETSVTEDGTVMQAYLRRRASPIRDLTAIGGREHFSDIQKNMAVPDVAMGGLEGNSIDKATESPAPGKDELFVLLWRPVGVDGLVEEGLIVDNRTMITWPLAYTWDSHPLTGLAVGILGGFAFSGLMFLLGCFLSTFTPE